MRKSGRTSPFVKALREAIVAPPASRRVAEAMRGAEQSSELLIVRLQLAGIALFFGLYLASAAFYRAAATVGPVPFALAAYAVAVLWRGHLLRNKALTTASRLAFDIGDVAVLMILIWGFTLQYHASPAIYLKGPTLFYAFCLIALRALRFDARDVVVTGVAVMVGWTVLVIVAEQSARHATDYPDYMTSLSVYWGAEAEKLSAIAGVTTILALAVVRGRTLLSRLTSEEVAVKEISRLVAPEAAERARGDETLMAGAGELRPTAVLFLDLRGFSTFSATLSAADVIAFLNDYQRCVVPVIVSAGGVVDKFLGDGVLATFTDLDHRREAATAFSTIPKLLTAFEAWAQMRTEAGLKTPGFAVAATHGDVVHGLIGGGDRLEFTVIGEAVNLAAKLEKHAKAEHAKAIATFDAFVLAKRQGLAAEPLRRVASAAIDGVAAPLDLAILA